MTEYIFEHKHRIEKCLCCPAKRDDYNVCNLAWEEIPNTDRIADFCPLKELPPHGDLIDLSEVVAEAERLRDSGEHFRSWEEYMYMALANVDPVLGSNR